MSVPSSPVSVLTKSQADEVLRYWLASLQLEEALAGRPRARRVAPGQGPVAPRLDMPSPGQDYFKLPLDDAFTALMCRHERLCKAFDAERSAFFETWLAARYRRDDDERELSHLATFPVVHLPRGELAGLLRYGLQLSFRDGRGAQFKVPTRGERRRKVFPEPPCEVALDAGERGARQWPFFVDTRLLQQQLGVARESIDSFFDDLRAQPELDEAAMLRRVCELLEAELGPGAGPSQPPAAGDEPLLARMTSAMARLLAQNAPSARVYPVALVVDATRTKTTWHLQRELQLLLEDHPDVAWEQDSSLGAYLTGQAPAVGMQPMFASLSSRPALSDSQRLAAERSWGSRLTAVQGPPGTGKTTLILHMAAQALVRQVDKLVEEGVMGSAVLVVTSTNNRAVDNVIDGFSLGETQLPLALRAGSRRVCEQVLGEQLARAHNFLQLARARSADERTAALNAARERYKALRTQLGDRLAAHVRACESFTKHNALRAELDNLTSAAAQPADAALPVLEPAIVHSLYEPLQKLRARVTELCELCEAAPSVTQLQAVDRHFRRTHKRELPELSSRLAQAGLPAEFGLPPQLPPSTDPAVLLEVWEDAAQAASVRLEELQLILSGLLGRQRALERQRSLERQLAGLELAPEVPISADVVALQGAVFEAAVAVREAWAAVDCERLGRVVQRSLAAVRGEGSLRSLWSDGPEDWEQLRQLFGVWGSTLLSLGNCFPARSAAIDLTVIDEAGQCHPAFAVSALLRSRAALIIGDVHQLEPVIELEPADDERVLSACKLSLAPRLLAPYRVHNAARTSVQSLADRAVRKRPRLSDHFRCQPEIIAICDRLCGYELNVHTPPEGPAVPLPFLMQPVSFIDVRGEQERLGGSWHNAAELTLTLELLQMLLSAGIAPADVAVITPYRGQLERLHKQLVRLGIPIDLSHELVDAEHASAPAGASGVTLGTVHRFQGGERSIVLFTSVVTRQASLAFLDQRENLLNVAISRARHRFVAVGDRALLERGQRTALLTRAASELRPEAFRPQLSLV